MIRFLLFLFGKTGFESCKSCETLKEQNAFLREEVKRLNEVLVEIVRPRQVEVPQIQTQLAEVKPNTFSRRRAALEEAERTAARVERDSPHMAKPTAIKFVTPEKPKLYGNGQSIEELEQELGVTESNG